MLLFCCCNGKLIFAVCYFVKIERFDSTVALPCDVIVGCDTFSSSSWSRQKKNMPLQNAYATNNVQCIFLVHITTCNHQGLVCLLSAATKSWGQQRVGRSTWGRCQVKHGYERNGATNHISHYIMTHSNHPKNITLILDAAKLFTNQNNHATGKYIYLFIHIYIYTHTHTTMFVVEKILLSWVSNFHVQSNVSVIFDWMFMKLFMFGIFLVRMLNSS